MKGVAWRMCSIFRVKAPVSHVNKVKQNTGLLTTTRTGYSPNEDKTYAVQNHNLT